MGKRERRIFTEEFRREAVRLTGTSGRTIVQVANDLGLGLSTLTRWKRQHRDADLLAGPHEDVNKEIARLRKENELLRQERDLLKKGLFRQGDESMKFRLIDANKADMPVDRMCTLLDVSVSGYYAWKKRAPSQRQLDDFVLLAHIRAQFALSNETYSVTRACMWRPGGTGD